MANGGCSTENGAESAKWHPADSPVAVDVLLGIKEAKGNPWVLLTPRIVLG